MPLLSLSLNARFWKNISRFRPSFFIFHILRYAQKKSRQETHITVKKEEEEEERKQNKEWIYKRPEKKNNIWEVQIIIAAQNSGIYSIYGLSFSHSRLLFVRYYERDSVEKDNGVDDDITKKILNRERFRIVWVLIDLLV